MLDYEEVGVLGRGCAYASNPRGDNAEPGPTHLTRALRWLPRSVFGEAVLVEHQASGERLVVKHIPLTGLTATEVSHALVEVEALRMLQHPNIVRYRDAWVVESDGRSLTLLRNAVTVAEERPGGLATVVGAAASIRSDEGDPLGQKP